MQSLVDNTTQPSGSASAAEAATTLHGKEDFVWEDFASCRTVENAAELFFGEQIREIAAAKRVCADCPVLAPCLEGALQRREPVGVWGGQLFLKGKIVTVKKPRGRPPKVVRSEDVMPSIPIPAHLVEVAEQCAA